MQKKANKILSLLKKTGALLTGHFQLSSGLHSEQYLQCALLLKSPKYAEYFGKRLAKRFKKEHIDLVVSPALGGIIIGHEVARALGVHAIFTERELGQMVLRRGFKIEKGNKVLIVEDVLTTGGSLKEVIELVRAHGGEVVGCAVLIDRSGKRVELNVKIESLSIMDIPVYPKEDCPLCKRNIALIRPGSRIVN